MTDFPVSISPAGGLVIGAIAASYTFGGFSGGVAFDPNKVLVKSSSPPIVLTDFRLFNKSVDPGPGSFLKEMISYSSALTLTHDQNIFSIEFSGLSYDHPDTTTYRYRLEGLDNGRNEVGSDERTAVYNSLPQGEYTFRVQASSGHGTWSEPGVTLHLKVLPPWWKTIWFRTFYCSLIALLVWFAYRYRLRQIAREYSLRVEGRVNERTRIARELHDTLLQSIQGLILKIHAIAQRIPTADPTRQEIEKTLDYADQVLAEGRDRVRSLRFATVSDGDLSAAFQLVAEEASPDRTATFKTVVEGSVRELNPMIREESYSVGREAIINALNHSGGRNVEVEIIYDSSAFRLRIRDDGRGIAPGVLEKGGRADHWGLQGMRERANSIGAKLDLWSRPESGTEVELTVPATTAYRSLRSKPADSRSRVSASG